jgi:hypothetical protein
VIFIGSAILFAIGMLLLLISAARIAFGLIKIAVLLVAWCGCTLALIVCAILLFLQWCAKHVMILVRRFKGIPEPVEPEPMITINIVLDGDDDDTALRSSSCRAQAFVA